MVTINLWLQKAADKSRDCHMGNNIVSGDSNHKSKMNTFKWRKIKWWTTTATINQGNKSSNSNWQSQKGQQAAGSNQKQQQQLATGKVATSSWCSQKAAAPTGADRLSDGHAGYRTGSGGSSCNS